MSLAQSKAEGLIQRAMLSKVSELEKRRLEEMVTEAKVEVEAVNQKYTEATRSAAARAKELEQAGKDANLALKNEEEAKVAAEKQALQLQLDMDSQEKEFIEKLDSTRSEVEENLAKRRRSFQGKLVAARSQAEENLAKRRKSFEGKLEEVRADAAENLRKRRRSFEGKINVNLEALKVARVETDELKRKLEDLGAERERQLTDAKQAMEEERQRLEEDRAAEMKRVITDMKKRHDDEMSQVIYERERMQDAALKATKKENDQRTEHQRAEIALRTAQQKEELSRIKAQELMKRVVMAKKNDHSAEELRREYEEAAATIEASRDEVLRSKEEADAELQKLRVAHQESEEASRKEIESLKAESAEKLKNLMALHDAELSKSREENDEAAKLAVGAAKREVESRLKMELDKKKSDAALKAANMLMKRAMLNKVNKIEQMKMIESAKLAEQEYEAKLKAAEESRKDLEFAAHEAKRTAEQSIAKNRELNEMNLKHEIETIENKTRCRWKKC